MLQNVYAIRKFSAVFLVEYLWLSLSNTGYDFGCCARNVLIAVRLSLCTASILSISYGLEAFGNLSNYSNMVSLLPLD